MYREMTMCKAHVRCQVPIPQSSLTEAAYIQEMYVKQSDQNNQKLKTFPSQDCGTHTENNN